MPEEIPLWKAQEQIPFWEIDFSFLHNERFRIRTGGKAEYPNHCDLVVEKHVVITGSGGLAIGSKWEKVGMMVPEDQNKLLKALWAHLENPIMRQIYPGLK